MPLTKDGYRYVLTAVCMATKWPDAVALKSVAAKTVAEATMEILSRTVLPLFISMYEGAKITQKIDESFVRTLVLSISIPLHTTPK